MAGVVIQLDARANLYVRVRFTQSLDFLEIDAFVVTIVIGKGDVAQAPRPRGVDPGLQELC